MDSINEFANKITKDSVIEDFHSRILNSIMKYKLNELSLSDLEYNLENSLGHLWEHSSTKINNNICMIDDCKNKTISKVYSLCGKHYREAIIEGHTNEKTHTNN